jgi:hypothetical protein
VVFVDIEAVTQFPFFDVCTLFFSVILSETSSAFRPCFYLNLYCVIVAEELKAHWEKLERERRQNEALTSKLAEMESAAGRRETDISDLKRLLQLVKEEHQQVMQVNNGSSPYLVVVVYSNNNNNNNNHHHLKTRNGNEMKNFDQTTAGRRSCLILLLVCVCVCVGPFQAARENRGRHATISPMN